MKVVPTWDIREWFYFIVPFNPSITNIVLNAKDTEYSYYRKQERINK